MTSKQSGRLAALLASMLDKSHGTAGSSPGRRWDKPQAGAVIQLPYRVRDDVMSPAEAAFFRVLTMVVAGRWLVWPKVSLTDIFCVPQAHDTTAAMNRITRKHVDFLLCDATTLRPFAAIMLDATSRHQVQPIERDLFVEQVFEAAHLPLLRFPVQRSYAPLEIEACLAQTQAQYDDLPSPRRSNHTVSGAPVCPKCRVPMVTRTAARGETTGKLFYGCPNYPRCRETLPLVAG
ncbi:MAG: DUF2726 domain-containing protein [Chloroflexota bacterium]|nr:DUF2726 domain-containing protein [Chloroflexota bacterium]